jgi:TolB-like protein/DNA-binding winged helix-turn-helix (wHTH) protein/Tfp pilus assembly protein PilF
MNRGSMNKDQFTFGRFRVDVGKREVWRDEKPVRLGGRTLDILCVLVSAKGDVVTKDELMARVWPGLVVEENNIQVHVSTLRKALDEGGNGQSYLVTVPRRGYRLIGLQAPPSAEPDAFVRPRAVALPDKPSIAVLPFTNMGGDPEQEYFADGMAEDLITNLSRLRSLFVIARNSTFVYKPRTIDVRQIAADLRVRYILEGSVRRTGNRVRVTTHLVDAENSRQIWAERYDRAIEDVFVVQDEITDTIAATLEPEISAAERDRARRKPPGHLGAWELYQRGMWYLLRRNRGDFEAARSLLREAIAFDPTFATAHAAFAISAFWQITHGFTSDAEASRTELVAAASRAIELDPRDALAHSAMGLGYMECGQHAKALEEHEISTELNPNSAFGQWCFGYTLTRADRYDDALAKFDLALRLSPRDPAAWTYFTLKAAALYQQHRYEEAAPFADNAARIQVSDVVWPLIWLAASLGQLNRRGEAAPIIDELRSRRPGLTITEFESWPHNQPRSTRALEHISDGLRKAGLPE